MKDLIGSLLIFVGIGVLFWFVIMTGFVDPYSQCRQLDHGPVYCTFSTMGK